MPNKFTIEYLTEHFSEDELYDWAVEKEELVKKLYNAIHAYNRAIKDLKKSIEENDEFIDKLWEAKYIVATRNDEKKES